MNNESEFRKYTMGVGEAMGGHVSSVEAHTSAAGIPDLNIHLGGEDLWLELKVIKEGHVRMRPTQKRWHKDRHEVGGQSWVLVLNRVTDRILVIPGHVAAGLDSRVHSWEAARDAEWWQATALPDLFIALTNRIRNAKHTPRGNGAKEDSRGAQTSLSTSSADLVGHHWLTSKP